MKLYRMRKRLKRVPLLGSMARWVYFRVIAPRETFTDSANYWRERYKSGGTSGEGSSGVLAHYKAQFLNDFVTRYRIRSVIEFGCGDGTQLRLARYPQYHGFDISPDAIDRCRSQFGDDPSKEFSLVSEYGGQQADLSLSLDVIYHLVEDDAYLQYMDVLFRSALRFVIIYSSNTNAQFDHQPKHVRHREFTDYAEDLPEWSLLYHEPNPYPYRGDDTRGSFADFYVFQRIRR